MVPYLLKGAIRAPRTCTEGGTLPGNRSSIPMEGYPQPAPSRACRWPGPPAARPLRASHARPLRSGPRAPGRARGEPELRSSATPPTPRHPSPAQGRALKARRRSPPAEATATDHQDKGQEGHTGRDTRGPDSGKIKDPPTLRAPSLTLLCTCSAPPRCDSPAPATRAGCWRTAPPWTQ